MSDASAPHVLTRLLRAWQDGDAEERERLMTLVYDRVRAIAAQSLQQQTGSTLTPTELAQEALMRLLGADAAWADRRHFFHVVAQATRQVLVDRARKRLAERGPRGQRGTAATNSGVYVRDRVLGTTTPVPRPTVAGQLADSCRESDVPDIGTVLMTCYFPRRCATRCCCTCRASPELLSR